MLDRPNPLVFMILNGFGHTQKQTDNAIPIACWNQLQKDYPMSYGNTCNYANCDIVDHSDIILVAILAVKAMDRALQCILLAFYTANLVPSAYVCGNNRLMCRGLPNLTPTMSAMLDIDQLVKMTGKSFLKAA